MAKTKKPGYKVPIDKAALRNFLLGGDMAKAEKELKKIVFVVLKCHFSNYLDDREEMESMCLHYLLAKDRIGRFDPSGDAYNYIFTIFRNCIGNYHTKQRQKVSLCEDVLGDGYAAEDRDTEGDLPDAVTDMILGDSSDDFVQLTPREALMVGVVCHVPSRMPSLLTTLLRYRTPMDVCQAVVKILSVMLTHKEGAAPDTPCGTLSVAALDDTPDEMKNPITL